MYLATVQTIQTILVAADATFVQLWFLLAIQNHDTITAVCNRLATVSIPTQTRLLQLKLFLPITDLAINSQSLRPNNLCKICPLIFTWLAAQYTIAISTLHCSLLLAFRGCCIYSLTGIIIVKVS